MEQRTPEWYEARKGRITGSNVGAILGLSPYRTPEDVMRDMVREYHGLEREFKGNVATEYGTYHEAFALADYELEYNPVEKCGFITRGKWLGASPDGLVGENGLVEFKCPYSLRNGGEFKTLEQQPYYFAQIQIQLHVTKRKWCDFYQWSSRGHRIERVDYDELWIAANLPKLGDFYADYLEQIKLPYAA